MAGEMKKLVPNKVENLGGDIEVDDEGEKGQKLKEPAIFSRFSTFGLNIISQAFIGHIGSAELAAYALVFTVLLRFANGILLHLEFQTAKKGVDPMLEYILKIKTISDNLAAIGEPVKETDHILQLLGGLGSEYNSIVASLTTREDDLSLYYVHNILLTYEQRLNHQHTSSTDLPFAAAHIAAAPSTQHLRPHQPRFQSPQPRFQSHHSGSYQQCYHHFDITYQGTNGVSPSQDSSPLQAMLATTPDHQDSWFFDTGATHHLNHSAQTLSHVQPYSGANQVTIGDGHSLPILNTDQVTKQTLLKGWLRDGLYEFPSSSSTHAFVSTSSVPALTPGAIWHSRLGHSTAPILSKALASSFKPYLEAHGIVHQFSCPHTPQQNGRAERKIRHLVEIGMTLLAQSFLPSKYWSFAFQTSVYLINLLSTKLLNFQSPLQVLFHKIPNYHHLRVFGCLCFPSLRPYNHHKLSYRSTACVFLGYASAHKGYICLDVSTSRLYISRDVLFHESSFPFQSIPAPLPLPQHTPLTSALINPHLLSTSSPPTVSFPVHTSSPDCTSTSNSLPPLLQVPFAPTPSPTPSSFPSPLNTHPMVTKAKSGIHKKKSFLMQTTSEPHTYNQASKSEP
uniref:Integrase catalytic domain-containing protein n=1 Tax=Vitis vinifera TaxID=29760 RepID=A5BRZ4_VITVI|nr:hypothetical protein VITISV_022026 [Vitis vinifera]